MNLHRTLAIACLAFMGPAWAQVSPAPAPEPLQRLIHEALQSNPEIRAAHSELEVARHRVRPAGALEDPMVEAGLINVPATGWRLNREDMTMVAALAAANPVYGEELTLEEARRRATDAQPAVRALEHAWRAGQLNALAEGALPDPRLKLGALNYPARGFPGARDDMTQTGISWEQPVPGGDKRRLRSEKGQAEANMSQAEAHSLMETIQRDVSLAWMDAWLAAASERLYGELATEYSRALEAAGTGIATGRGSQADLIAQRQLLNQLKDRRLELAQQAERARAGLARWIPGAASLRLPEALPALAAAPDLKRLRESLATHPQHEMHNQQQAVAEADVALAREATKPDRSFEVGYYARSGGRSDMLMFQVAIELPIFAGRKQDNQLAAKLRLADRAREQRADHLRQLQAELDAAHADWRIAGERLRNAEQSIVPDARARLDALVAQYRAGAVALAPVLEARRALIEARMQALALSAAQARARLALQYFEGSGAHR